MGRARLRFPNAVSELHIQEIQQGLFLGDRGAVGWPGRSTVGAWYWFGDSLGQSEELRGLGRRAKLWA